MVIKRHKVLVLFGAGASMPFFGHQNGRHVLSTCALTEAIFSDELWGNILGNNTDLNNLHPQILNLLHLIKCNLGEAASFEDIAEIIDMIGSLCGSSSSSQLINFIKIICKDVYKIDYYSKFENGLLNQSYKYLPYFFREVIADYIIKLYKAKPECYNQMADLQANLLRKLSNNFEYVALSTLNYDDCITDSISYLQANFSNGFRSETRFDDILFFKSKHTISYLHGHIRMGNSSRYFALLYDNLNDARKYRLGNYTNPFSNHSQNGILHEDYNIFLTTGKSKSSALNFIPYSAYYSKFAIDVFDADFLFIIGYSFNDAHINQLICNYLSFSQHHVLIIVDYLERGYGVSIDLKKYIDTLSIFVKLNGLYGVECYENIFDSTEESSIKENGYGWIMNHRAFLYIDGYEKFLRNSDSLLTTIINAIS